MNKVQINWKDKIKEMSNSPFGSVDMIIDGYNVHFACCIHNRRIVIEWFIDGIWKGEYINKNSEIGQKFGCAKICKIPKKLIDLTRMLDSKKAADEKKKVKIIAGYLSYWTSPTSLIRHLSKTCKEFQIVEKCQE